jgi:asparagine synthase (glutamine-hydrolysing)
MCGIAGIFARGSHPTPPSRELLVHMISALRHRGPDAYGLYRDGVCGFAHARLSIVDLVSGDQPMSTEDGNLTVVFNGEIYNFVELRDELQKHGHRFRTRSDTEVILHAYRQWGKECFHRFNGQWALALRDLSTGELLLCRDRVGVRPLYYMCQKQRIRFASEIKAFFADPSVLRAVRPQALAETFTYWSPLSPATFFEGIEAVPPGSFMLIGRDGQFTMKRYWDPPFSEESPDPGIRTMRRTAGEVGEILQDAVRLRMIRADVPVGSYLSGGLDSSIIAALARAHATGDFHTFSVRFTDPQFDETAYQTMMTERLGCTHHDVLIAPADIARVFPRVVQHAEQPMLRTAPAPLFLLSELVRGHGIKTVLTGEGADEFFAGYDIFREAKIRAFWSRDPGSRMRPALFDRIYPYLTRSPQQVRSLALAFWKIGMEKTADPFYSHERRWTTSGTLRRFLTKDIAAATRPVEQPFLLPNGFAAIDPLKRAQYIEIATFFSQYLLSAQGDRMLMANSVEGRFPFLDARVMEYCCRIPAVQLLPGLKEKAVLKVLGHDLVPEAIRTRPKQPYRAPDALCFAGPDAPAWVDEVLAPETLVSSGFFDPTMVAGLRDKLTISLLKNGQNAAPSNADNMAMVGIVSAQLLYTTMISNPPPVALPGQWRLAVDAHSNVAG